MYDLALLLADAVEVLTEGGIRIRARDRLCLGARPILADDEKDRLHIMLRLVLMWL